VLRQGLTRARRCPRLDLLINNAAVMRPPQAASYQTMALAAHPGVARTGLFRWDPRLVRALLSPALRPVM
jgi:hypothetical protein